MFGTLQIFEFIEYTPDQFMSFSSVPPFKVNFNIDFKKTTTMEDSATIEKKRSAVPLTFENFHAMDECYNNLKKGI